MPEQSTRQHLRVFPTPDTRNMRVVDVADSQLPGTTYPTQLGSPHPNKTLFPAHRLTLEAPIENKPGWIKRVYATEDVGQDDYNYQIKFSAESTSHPIYARAYLYLRKGYAALPQGTRDPLFPGTDESPALLVEEEMRESEDADVRNLYVVVVRVYETLPSPELETSIYDEVFGFRVDTTEQRISSGSVEAAAGMDLIPESVRVELKRQVDLVSFGNQLSAIHLQIPTEEDIRLPPTLISAVAHFGGQVSDGYSTVTPQWQSAGWYSGGIQSISFAGSASASATVDADIAFRVKQGYSGPAAAILHLFFLPIADASSSNILTQVGASPWPVYRPISENLVVFGQHQSLEVSGKIDLSALVQQGANPLIFISTTKTGERRSGGINVKSIPIPAALCAGITVTTTGDVTKTASATIKRESPVLTVYDEDGSPISPSTTVNYATWPSAELEVEVSATGSFAPSTIPATTPTVFPTGRYLISSKASPFKYGWLQVTAMTVDITSEMV